MLKVAREANDFQQRQTWFIQHRALFAKLQQLMIEHNIEEAIEIE